MAKPLGLPLTSAEAEAKFACSQKKKNTQTRLNFVSNLVVNFVQIIGGQTSNDPEVSANVLLSLVNVTSYLLAQQMKTLEKEFLQQGGLRERMSQARIEVRKKQK